MSWNQGIAEVVERVATARQRSAVSTRLNESLAKIGTSEAVGKWLAPRGWQSVVETYAAAHGQAADDRQAGLRSGGDEEAMVRASAGAAMLVVSHSLGEPTVREDEIGYSLENAMANLLHVADEVGVDPFQALAGALERYEDTLVGEDGVQE